MTRYKTDNEAVAMMAACERALSATDSGKRRVHVFPREKKYGGGYGFCITGESYKVSSSGPESFRVSLEGMRRGNISAHGYEGTGRTLGEAIADACERAQEDAAHMLRVCHAVGHEK